MDPWQKTIPEQVIPDIFKVITANTKHIEVSFLANRSATISAVDSSLIDPSLVLKAPTSTCRSSIHGSELGH